MDLTKQMVADQNAELLVQLMDTRSRLAVYGRNREYTEVRYEYLNVISFLFKVVYVFMLFMLVVTMFVTKKFVPIAGRVVIVSVFVAVPVILTVYIDPISTMTGEIFQTLLLAIGFQPS